MQLNSVDALSSVSAQNALLQKADTAEISYQVKLDGDNRNAVVEKTDEGYRAHISGTTDISVYGASVMAAEMNLSAKIIDLHV